VELFLRFSVSVVLLIALAGGLAYAQPAWLADLGLDFWNLPALERALAHEHQRQEKLKQESEQLQEKAQRRSEVIQELVAERISLAEAAARIRDLCEPFYLEQALSALEIPGRTENERLCRLAIYWAGAILRDSPAQAARVQARLEGQLGEELRTNNGQIVLP